MLLLSVVVFLLCFGTLFYLLKKRFLSGKYDNEVGKTHIAIAQGVLVRSLHDLTYNNNNQNKDKKQSPVVNLVEDLEGGKKEPKVLNEKEETGRRIQRIKEKMKMYKKLRTEKYDKEDDKPQEKSDEQDGPVKVIVLRKVNKSSLNKNMEKGERKERREKRKKRRKLTQRN